MLEVRLRRPRDQGNGRPLSEEAPWGVQASGWLVVVGIYFAQVAGAVLGVFLILRSRGFPP
jgi:hypothetical protein